MNLQDVFQHLAHSELSQLFVGEDGDIKATMQPQIASSVTLGLADLYKRFLIKEASETVTLTEGTLTYTLVATDLIKVERIVDSSGNEITINDVDDEMSFTFMSDKTFSVEDDYLTWREKSSEDVTVYYRASHPVLNRAAIIVDPSTVAIELPSTYLTALILYVASRVHTPTGLTNEFHKGNDYLTKYETEVARLHSLNVQVDRQSETDRFTAGGWV